MKQDLQPPLATYVVIKLLCPLLLLDCISSHETVTCLGFPEVQPIKTISSVLGAYLVRGHVDTVRSFEPAHPSPLY
jgi:hypothetical protein